MCRAAISAPWLARISACEDLRQIILVDFSSPTKNIIDGERHFGVVRVMPRRSRQMARFNHPFHFVWMAEEAFAKCVADRQPGQSQVRVLLSIAVIKWKFCRVRHSSLPFRI